MRIQSLPLRLGALFGFPLLFLLVTLSGGCETSREETTTSRRFEVVGNAPSCCEGESKGDSQSEASRGAESPITGESQALSSEESAEKKEGDRAMQLKLTSPAFQSGQPIPKKHTGEGADVSPALEWSNVPEGTQEFALICDDPDAPTAEPWVHWVIYKIPPDVTKLAEGIAKTPKLSNPAGALQGKNSWPSGQTIGYRGPMPPPGHGRHRYYFRIYALDKKLDLPPGASKKELLEAMKGHILAQGELMGTYERH